jgi:formylglycine-generating enzyme required for sulfatase activity
MDILLILGIKGIFISFFHWSWQKAIFYIFTMLSPIFALISGILVLFSLSFAQEDNFTSPDYFKEAYGETATDAIKKSTEEEAAKKAAEEAAAKKAAEEIAAKKAAEEAAAKKAAEEEAAKKAAEEAAAKKAAEEIAAKKVAEEAAAKKAAEEEAAKKAAEEVAAKKAAEEIAAKKAAEEAAAKKAAEEIAAKKAAEEIAAKKAAEEAAAKKVAEEEAAKKVAEEIAAKKAAEEAAAKKAAEEAAKKAAEEEAAKKAAEEAAAKKAAEEEAAKKAAEEIAAKKAAEEAAAKKAAEEIAAKKAAEEEAAKKAELNMEMVLVKGGAFFTMGCTSEQRADCNDDERPIQNVSLNDYYISKYPVTQRLWKKVMGTNPSHFSGPELPVESVSWNEVQMFVKELNAMTGKKYRLPTEAEWEYAARGGVKSKSQKYSGSNDLGKVAWHGNNSEQRTHDVGTKQPNELGIYDMNGNVWEWVQDWKENYSSSQKLKTNPAGPNFGINRVYRGCSWQDADLFCRVSRRGGSNPDFSSSFVGFRLVLAQ